MTVELSQDSIKINKPRCPYCHDDIRAEEEKSGCNQCMAWFHSECWSEHGGCTSCANPASTTAPTPPQVPIDLYTAHPQKPSIHNSLGYSLISPAQRSAAMKSGLKDGLRALAMGLIPTLIIATIAFTVLPFTPGAELVTLGVPGTLLMLFWLVYTEGRKKQLRCFLNQNLEASDQTNDELQVKVERSQGKERN